MEDINSMNKFKYKIWTIIQKTEIIWSLSFGERRFPKGPNIRYTDSFINAATRCINKAVATLKTNDDIFLFVRNQPPVKYHSDITLFDLITHKNYKEIAHKKRVYKYINENEIYLCISVGQVDSNTINDWLDTMIAQQNQKDNEYLLNELVRRKSQIDLLYTEGAKKDKHWREERRRMREEKERMREEKERMRKEITELKRLLIKKKKNK